MFSCNSLIYTSQLRMYEGSNKIEMYLQDKPLCATWNAGAAVQGLVDATSTNFDIVNDPVQFLDRNFPLNWTATNEGCLLYTSPSPRDGIGSRMPSSA